jgi:UDP-N-acetylmuramate dehydrogenase
VSGLPPDGDAEQDLALVSSRLGGRAEARPLGPYTTYRVGGSARLFVEVDDLADLRVVAEALRETAVPLLVLGNGSNLLVADTGFPGVAVRLGAGLAEIDLADDGTVRAGGAALLPVVARRSAAAGLRGFEWAVGVPGTIGGAVRMNAGGHGSDMAATLTRVRVVDLRLGDDEVVASADLALGYRTSSVRPDQVVVWAELALTPGSREEAEVEVAEVVRWRREHQPGGANAGSVFTNPPDDSAGRLIDAAGLKGHRVGSAEVSTKHANFIQADEGGSAADVYRLMVDVRERVYERFGVALEPETRLVGFPRVTPLTGSGTDA